MISELQIEEATHEELTCKSCEEPYSTRRIPRILDCGHCLCTACVKCTIKSNRECPVCHSATVGLSESAFPVDDSIMSKIRTKNAAGFNGQNDRSYAVNAMPKKYTPLQETIASFSRAVTISMDYVNARFHIEPYQAERYPTWETSRPSLTARRMEGNFHEMNSFDDRVHREGGRADTGCKTTVLENGAEASSCREVRFYEEPSKIIFKKFSLDSGEIGKSLALSLEDTSANLSDEDDEASMLTQASAKQSNDDVLDCSESVGMCIEHEQPISFMCLTCNIWGCCSCSGHQDDLSGCFLLDPQEAVKTFKTIFKDTMSMHVRIIRRVKRSVKRETSGIKVIENYFEKKAARIRAELSLLENNLQEVKTRSERALNTNSELNAVAKTLRSAYRDSKDSNTAESVVKTMEILENCVSILNKYPIDDVQKIISIPNIQIHNRKDIIGLLEAGAPLYGVHEHNGVKTYSQLTLNDGHILLHCLRNDVYPHEGVALLTLQYDKLRKMVPVKYASVFMDIGWAGERRGRVYAKMFGDTPRSRKALLLCSGEKRVSYINTVFYKRTEHSSWIASKRQEILHGGDYEHNNGEGGRAILEDITNGGEYHHPLLDGLMVSCSLHEHWKLGSFSFYVKGDPDKFSDTAFGKVTRGLEFLKAAAKQNPVSSSYVCDCGLVIPL